MNMKLSIVIPLLNEAENLSQLYNILTDKVFQLFPDYELIFIDDGSTDNTREIVKELIEKDTKVQLICLSRNWGHQPALIAGLNHVSGDYIITMDGDLQHPPQLIPEIIKKSQLENFDIIHLIKTTQHKRPFIQKISATLFYKIFNYIADIDLEEHSSDFRLYTKKAVCALNQIQEKDIFLRGISRWLGFHQSRMEYIPNQRYRGEAAYNLHRLAHLAGLGLFSFSIFPIRVSVYIGLLISFLNFIIVFIILVRNIIYGINVPGYLSIIISILFLFSFLFIFLGIIGEYIYRIFMEVKNRPLYIIDEHIKKSE